MFQTVPQRGLSKPRLIGSFKNWSFVTVQVVTPQTLYLAESDTCLQQTSDDGAIEALQIVQASGIVQFWWKGDLWAAGSSQFKPIIVIPGQTAGSMSEDYAVSGANLL